MKRAAVISVVSPIIFAVLIAVASGEQKPEPKLSTTEQIALHSVSAQLTQLKQEIAAIEIDIAKNHPGYHLDSENPLSGQLVPNEPAKK